ncbi:MAG TPA: META domain-containing protein [Campylobacterales bacterium]|nr:META domain-containing protein [Campylobacterales bacterium]HIP60719.1 META domain-containing protein [Campylobacterales bacterium]
MKKIILTISLLFLIGCGSSNGQDGTISVNLGSDDNALGTLSTQNMDLKETLSGENWEEITMDLDQFYTTSISTVNKTYKIDMGFKDGKVTAYADCQKLTARYKISDKEISFSRVSYEADLDHAFCQQSEDADEAVNQFLNNSFEAIRIKEDEITFQSDDFDAEVILSF